MNETMMNGMGYPMSGAAVAPASASDVPMQTPVQQTVPVEVSEQVEKMYNIRGLGAKDIFPMVNIIRKIGLKDFGKCFEPDEIRSITETFSETDNVEDMAKTVGVSVVLKIVDVILENLSAAEQEIFSFLGGITDLSVDDVANLPMDVFFELVVDVFQRKEFVGFMRAVSRLLK